jgi:hypothetical protein
MKLGPDVLPDRFEQLAEERALAGLVASVDRASDLRCVARLIGRAEELDVGERLVEDRELVRVAPRPCPHDLPPSVGERVRPRFAPLCIDRAPHAEEPRDYLREDDQRSTKSPTERIHDPSPPAFAFLFRCFRRDDGRAGRGSTCPSHFFSDSGMGGHCNVHEHFVAEEAHARGCRIFDKKP